MLVQVAIASFIAAALAATETSKLDLKSAEVKKCLDDNKVDAVALTACLKPIVEKAILADAQAAAQEASAQVDLDEQTLQKLVQKQLNDLLAVIRGGRRTLVAWCQQVLDDLKSASINSAKCRDICDSSTVNEQASIDAFECALPLANQDVQNATPDKRDSAVGAQQALNVLFTATQFKDPNQLVLDRNNQASFGTDLRNTVLDKSVEAAAIALQDLIESVNATRAIVDGSVAPDAGIAVADAQLVAKAILDELEKSAALAQNREQQRNGEPRGDAADKLFVSGDGQLQISGSATATTSVTFTDLAVVDDALINDKTFQAQLPVGLTINVAGTKKRANVATEVGVFSANAREKLFNKLAVNNFCKQNALKCKASVKGGVVAREALVEADTKTQAEIQAEIEAAKTTKYYATKTTKYVKTNAPYGAAVNPTPAPTDSASSLFVAAGAVLVAVAMFF